MPDVDAINEFIQRQLIADGQDTVTAVEAAEWLESVGLLRDSPSRPGLPLRRLLRAGKIVGQRQENRRWFIDPTGHSDKSAHKAAVVAQPPAETTHGQYILPDILAQGLRIVFVGAVVGDVSAKRKHYYANPGNCFWPILHETGIIPVKLTFADDHRVLKYGIGLTDIVKAVHTGDNRNLRRGDYARGRASLEERLLHYRPQMVCFNGKDGFRGFFGKPAHFGLAKEQIGSSKVFVVPSTSGRVPRNAAFDGKTRRQWFESLKEELHRL